MYYDENQPQMDAGNDNPEGLPTYNYLEEQERSNPNSRFGRWRSWVEKRAAERYADVTEEEKVRRRNKGWGTTLDTDVQLGAPAPSGSIMSPSSALLVSDRLRPTSLSIYRFGSRFLPHSIAPIRSLVPLMDDRYLLIGSSEGVAVLDIFPETESFSADDSTLLHALEGAKRKDMWTGESIHQMTLLESTIDRSGNHQGVILALVSAEESEGDREPVKSVRMYNLASILSLAKWAASQKDAKPVTIHGPKGWNPQQTTPKRLHRHQASTIAKSFKAISLDSHNIRPSSPPGSLASIRTTPASVASVERTPPKHQESIDSVDSWEVVDDLPLRWATDYVNLANPGSKLASAQVLFYETWKNGGVDGRGTSMLAIATKTSILLYETPKGERAFRFVKEFYTPLSAKSINFLHQTSSAESSRLSAVPTEKLKKERPPSQAGSETSLLGSPRIRRISTPGDFTYGSQLSLFVIFEKKAGLIRMSDSAVSEIDLWDDGGGPPSPQPTGSLPTPASGGSGFRKSLDAFAFGRETKGMWLPLTSINVPMPPSKSGDLPQAYASRTLIIISRGRQTHIYPSPLPMPLTTSPPLLVIRWQNPPRQVTARLSVQPGKETKLQVVAFTDAGVDVAEGSLNFLYRPPERSSSLKGKGKVKSIYASDPLIRGRLDFVNHVGFLARGGLWHDLDTESGPRPGFKRYNMELDSTVWNNVNVEQGLGIYAWCYQGFEDYRVFWLGEDVSDEHGQLNRVLSEY